MVYGLWFMVYGLWFIIKKLIRMTYSYSFEKLTVWKNARVLTNDIYKITRSFPNDEKFGLVNQMRRAAVSIGSNIAEGSGRTGKRDQGRFYQIALSSAFELLSQLITSQDQAFIDKDTYLNLRRQIESITRPLNGLVKSTGYLVNEPEITYIIPDDYFE